MSFLTPPPISETELSAYVDGEAFPERQAVVEAWLARNPAEAARVKAWRRQNQALRASLGRIVCEPVPAALTRASRPAEGAAKAKVTPLVTGAGRRPAGGMAPWDRRDLFALTAAGSFLAGAGVACLAGYLMG